MDGIKRRIIKKGSINKCLSIFPGNDFSSFQLNMLSETSPPVSVCTNSGFRIKDDGKAVRQRLKQATKPAL
jgi:hypothetical protein